MLPPSSALNRLVHPSDGVRESNALRLTKVHDSMAAIQAHPWAGSGFAAATYGHDLVLQIATSAGLIGLAGYLLVGWSTLGAVWTTRSGQWRWLGLPSLAYLVAAGFVNNLWDRYVWFALALGLHAATRSRTAPEQRPFVAPPGLNRHGGT